jgi:predicted transcriptional regulator
VAAAKAHETKLLTFLRENRISSARVEKAAGMNRQNMTKLKWGKTAPRLSTMRRVLGGIRQVTGRPVRMEEIFDLEPPSAS